MVSLCFIIWCVDFCDNTKPFPSRDPQRSACASCWVKASVVSQPKDFISSLQFTASNGHRKKWGDSNSLRWCPQLCWFITKGIVCQYIQYIYIYHKPYIIKSIVGVINAPHQLFRDESLGHHEKRSLKHMDWLADFGWISRVDWGLFVSFVANTTWIKMHTAWIGLICLTETDGQSTETMVFPQMNTNGIEIVKVEWI